MGSFDYSHWRKPKWACFQCRKVYNREHRQCPNCGGTMNCMGTHFKTPKRNRNDEWQAIEMLYRAGVRYEVYDTHQYVWSERYRVQRYKFPDEFLWQVLAENGIGNRDSSQWRWNPAKWQWSGPRPTHPRDVSSYLEWREGRIVERIADVLEICERLDWPKPDIAPELYEKAKQCLGERVRQDSLLGQKAVPINDREDILKLLQHQVQTRLDENSHQQDLE